MSNWIIVILCAVAAVALFVAGMSLTLMLKGHHIDSEISTNKEMQRRGIKCAVQETREAMQQGRLLRHVGSLLGQLRRLRRGARTEITVRSHEEIPQRRKPGNGLSALRNPSVPGHGCGRPRKSVIFDRSSDVSGFAAA